MAKSLLHCWHRRACAGVCAFAVVGVACTSLLSTSACACVNHYHHIHTNTHTHRDLDRTNTHTHTHTCTHTRSHTQTRYERCLSKPVYIFVNTLSAGCAHALVYAQFVYYRWGTRGGVFGLSMQGTCCLRVSRDTV